MSIKQEARLLERKLGGPLADRVHELRDAQRQELAAFVAKHGYMESLNALYVNAHEIEGVMNETGHTQCSVCNEWFELDGAIMCEACAEESQ